MSRRVHVVTWGCQMNEYDSDKLLDLLRERNGFEPTDLPGQADLLVLNTCSIREKAQEKLFHQLGQWKRLKEHDTPPVIAVGGCVAMQEGEAIRKRAPYVDILFGPQTIHKLPELLERCLAGRKEREPISDLSFAEIEKFDHIPAPRSSKVVASVTIMEGCDKFCSYCIVPYTRGGEVCRPMEDILREVRQSLALGAKEIVLLGQNVNAWRFNLEGKILQFSDLLRALAQLPELLRIRFITSHPTEFSKDLIELLGEEKKIASAIHLPVQSGSNQTLERMGRGHTVEQYLRTVEAIRLVRPDALLGTDLIVGFPGETEQEFEATLKLAEQVKFDISYSFIFSPRPGTPAALLEDSTPMKEKKERLYRLQRVLSSSVLEHTRKSLGTLSEVLVEEKIEGRPGWYRGRNTQNRWVKLAAESLQEGSLKKVRLVGTEGSAFVGRLEDEA